MLLFSSLGLHPENNRSNYFRISKYASSGAGSPVSRKFYLRQYHHYTINIDIDIGQWTDMHSGRAGELASYEGKKRRNCINA